MKILSLLLGGALLFTGVARAEQIPGDFEPQVRYECRCGCAALGMSRLIRVWDNVNRVYYYERVGVSLFEYDQLGQIYELRFPIGNQQACQPYNGQSCWGLHQERVGSDPIRLEGRYYRCHKEVVRLR